MRREGLGEAVAIQENKSLLLKEMREQVEVKKRIRSKPLALARWSGQTDLQAMPR
jgi:hypothetical protein